MPVSIIAVEHGRLLVAGVPHVPGKRSAAVLDTPLMLAAVGTYVFRMRVPNVLGKACFANAANCWSGKKSVWLPVDADERSGAAATKKKNCLWGTIGPPTVKDELLAWNGLYFWSGAMNTVFENIFSL